MLESDFTEEFEPWMLGYVISDRVPSHVELGITGRLRSWVKKNAKKQ